MRALKLLSRAHYSSLAAPFVTSKSDNTRPRMVPDRFMGTLPAGGRQ
jgi:hypothetical protein